MRLIDADALKAYIEDYACIPCKKFGIDRDGVKCKYCGFRFCLDGIDRHRIVDAVPVVHGYNKRDCKSLYECSVCGWECWDTLCGDTDIYNFCPNCGAKMDEKGKEDG